MSFEIPREEVENMGPEDFVGTFTYDSDGSESWIQRNEEIIWGGNLLFGIKVWGRGDVAVSGGWDFRDKLQYKHYRTLEDLVEDCDDEELLKLFLKEL